MKLNHVETLKNNTPLVSVIIVTWNSSKDIETCLNSITDQDYTNFNIVVVDNASSDDTMQIVTKSFSKVNLIKLKKNVYLTGGNNIGISYAINNFNPEFILVINPDTKSDKNLISVLVSILKKNPNTGAVGPKIKFWNNINEGLINSVGLIYDGFMEAYDIGFMQKDNGQFDEDKEVFGVSGACILYRTKMLNEIGVYFNAIKMYLDEVELFIRAKKHGWKVIFTYKTTLHHNYMQSTKQNTSFNKRNQVSKAWLLIALRHYKLKSKIAMLLKFINLQLKNNIS